MATFSFDKEAQKMIDALKKDSKYKNLTKEQLLEECERLLKLAKEKEDHKRRLQRAEDDRWLQISNDQP